MLWRTPFLRSACIGLFISGIGVSSTMPQMTLFLVNELHLSTSTAGLYYLVNLLAPVSGFVVGSLSDRLQNRLVLYRLCALLAAIGWVAMSMATRPWQPFVIGAVALSLGGGAMGQLFAATRDELSRHPTAINNRVISAIRMAFSAGWIVGPVLGSWFGSAFGLRPLLVATAVCAIGQIVPLGTRRVQRYVRPSPPMAVEQHDPTSTAAEQRPDSRTPLLIFLGCCVLMMNGDTMKFAYLPLYMENDLRLSDELRGAVIAIQPFLELLLMPFAARLADRFTPIRVLAGASLLGIGAHLCYATSTQVGGLFLGQILMSGVWAASAGLGITVAQQLYPQRVGLASSMYGSTLPLAGALGGALGAFGVGSLGIPHVFFIPAALTVCGFIGMVLTARRYRPDDSAFG
ncbi:MFS transporter [Microlunatus soli]|uniref:MFS transporter n=1 Tax=Microlunatus soli TaxID=630515 RepID=UPI0012F8C162|nr:MFS transporter [Microlunatus soli]